MDNDIEESKIKSFLTFQIGNGLYASSVKSIINIEELTKITKVSLAPDYMLGLINLRGKILPVIDTRKKFGIKLTNFSISSCILVLEVTANNESSFVGALVDGVKEVIEIDEHEIKNQSFADQRNPNYVITGVYKRNDKDDIIMILDLNSVFSSDDIASMRKYVSERRTELVQ